MISIVEFLAKKHLNFQNESLPMYAEINENGQLFSIWCYIDKTTSKELVNSIFDKIKSLNGPLYKRIMKILDDKNNVTILGAVLRYWEHNILRWNKIVKIDKEGILHSKLDKKFVPLYNEQVTVDTFSTDYFKNLLRQYCKG